MGYMTHFDGRIEIRPPLTWAEIRNTPWIDGDNRTNDLLIEVHEQREDTDDGERIVKEGRAIVPLQEDPYKGYDILQTLSLIVAAFPDRTYSGAIRCEGEEAADVRRLLVVDGEAVEWKAELIWPDGTREAGR